MAELERSKLTPAHIEVEKSHPVEREQYRAEKELCRRVVLSGILNNLN